MIEALFPPDVIALRATAAMANEPLHPDEARDANRMSVDRRREFALGRAVARHALAKLGVSDAVIPRGADRAPCWPAGVVGSLTHSGEFCAVAVAWREPVVGLGIDVEQDTPLSPRAMARICTERERIHLATLPPLPAGSWEKLVFSAKESFYKCYYGLTHTKLGFRDAEITFAPDEGSFVAHLLRADAPDALGTRRFPGRFALAAPYLATAVTLRRGDLDVLPAD